jgi:hypothetical protein
MAGKKACKSFGLSYGRLKNLQMYAGLENFFFNVNSRVVRDAVTGIFWFIKRRQDIENGF